MDNLSACPFCGAKIKSKRGYGGILYFICNTCGAITSFVNADSSEVEVVDPVAAWNRRVELENKPLTLDELREMDGEPIWTETIGIEESGRWELCTCETVRVRPLHQVLKCVTADGRVTDYEFDTYGKAWLAYRHKPTGEDALCK